MSEKEKLAVYLPIEKSFELDRHYKDDGSRSKTVFIEHAIDFYIGYLNAQNDSSFLPKSLLTAIDGRLGMFERRVSSLLYKQTVEADMAMSIVADSMELDEEYLRRQRAKSISNVKKTNGQLRFEKIARNASEVDDEYAEDYDEWQS